MTFVTFGVASIDAQLVAEAQAARECRCWRLIDDPKRPAVVLLDLQLARFPSLLFPPPTTEEKQFQGRYIHNN